MLTEHQVTEVLLAAEHTNKTTFLVIRSDPEVVPEHLAFKASIESMCSTKAVRTTYAAMDGQ